MNKKRLEELFGKGFDKLSSGKRSYSMVPKIRTPQTPISGRSDPVFDTVRVPRHVRQQRGTWVNSTPYPSQVAAIEEVTAPEVASEPALTREQVRAQVEELQRSAAIYERARVATQEQTAVNTRGTNARNWSITTSNSGASVPGFTYRLLTDEVGGGDELPNEPL